MQSKKKKIEPELLEPSQQTQAREYLGNLMNKERSEEHTSELQSH